MVRNCTKATKPKSMTLSAAYATQADLPVVSTAFEEVLLAIPYYNDLAKKTELEKYSLPALVNKLQDDPYSILLIKEGNQIAAFCFSRFDDYTIWLEWFGITAAFRGRHLSDVLLPKLEEAATARGCHKIWCDSRTANVQSIHILLKQGCEKIALLQNHWYSQDFFLWQKFLPHAAAL
ncbi:MAG: GNAT family N-acetyltransferase [Sphingobacteriaceae bacterium]|nr:MAG: GNAT family N-acetyltransferase [Sphingobacteriaceae bacterium]